MGSFEMVLRCAHLAPEHLASAAKRIERSCEVVGANPTISPRQACVLSGTEVTGHSEPHRYLCLRNNVLPMSPEWTQLDLARPERFELPTPWFVARYSIQLSYGRARE
jgi:hypothetical protein